MKPERWREVERMFHEVLARPRDERAAFLAEACGSDRELHREVSTLVQAHEDDPAFLESPIVTLEEPGAAAPGAPSAPPTPRAIGPYELVRPIGEGGMGEVYLARQRTRDFERPVAIKVVKRGMDTEEVLRRFTLERRILASLVHPNIAQLHDAGATTDGRPYFVMEFVDGERIDEWVRGRDLPIAERLRLFRAVCDAVQHAHRNLVVHRDIKPGNVLVTHDGVPKLVDFGIGKLLYPTGDAEPTRTAARVLTPDYASPEQLRGEPVSTDADVYALGALLFELLADRRPHADVRGTDAERASRMTGAAPPRPSDAAARSEHVAPERTARRARRLRGDLDTIVLKAMHHEPDRRYGSAAALSDDIGRYLSGHPIQARPDSFSYRARKFVKRNPWSVSTGGAIAAGLLAVTLTTTLQSRRVARERDKAQEVESFLLETFGASAPDGTTGDSVTVRQLLDAQVEALESTYGSDPELEAEMLAVVADAYDRLGLYDRAEPLARRALATRRTLYPGDDPAVASSLSLLGWIRHEQGESQEGADVLEQAVAMARRLGRDERERLSRALNDLGSVYDQMGRPDDAEPLLREALAIRRGDGRRLDRAVAITSNNLAVLLYRRGRYAAADSLGQVALEALRASLGSDHQRTILAQGNLATFRLRAGDVEGAAELQRDLLERQTRTQGPRHPRTAAVMVSYAAVLNSQGRSDEALEILGDALEIQTDALGPEHREVANTERLIGTVLLRESEPAEALPHLERAVEINRTVYGATHPLVAESLVGVALADERMGDLPTAVEAYRRAMAAFDASVGAMHPQAIDARLRLAHAELTQGHAGVAGSLVEEAERDLPSDPPPTLVSSLHALQATLDSIGG